MTSGAQRRLNAFTEAAAPRRLFYYELLGVGQDATEAEIVRAFRKLSLKLHPDKPGGSSEKFQELSKAYRCLKDSLCRRKYDDCGFDEDNIDTNEVDQFVDAFFGETARGLDGRSPDWSMGKIENYVNIDLTEVPFHMKDIARIGLNYLVSLKHDFENVVLLQHSRVDILYLMVGYTVEGPLTQEVYDGDASYPITYYDNPLQPGISPRWSDQNRLDGTHLKENRTDLARKELNFEEFQRRQKIALAMIENGPPDPMLELEEKYRAKMMAQVEDAARISEQKRCKALRGEPQGDIYEEDGEYDWNEYAAFKTQEKDAAPPPADADVREEAGDGDLGQTRNELAAGRDGQDGLVSYESRGRENVLGQNSDGVLFVAQGGTVLRNEGPPRPSA